MLELNKIYNEDCLKVLKGMPDECIDCVCSDVPYKIVSGGCTTQPYNTEPKGVLNHRRLTPHTRGNSLVEGTKHICLAGCLNDNTDDVRQGKMFEHNEIKFSEWLPDVYRVLKNGTHCYLMINSRNLKDLQTEAEKVGFKFQNLLVWNKGTATPNRYYMQRLEFILMLRKGSARDVNDMGISNLLSVPNIIGNKLHPTEKPVALMRVMIEQSTNAGDVVLDPFVGAGATAVACKECGRNYVACEIDKKYYDIAVKRLNNSVRQLELF